MSTKKSPTTFAELRRTAEFRKVMTILKEGRCQIIVARYPTCGGRGSDLVLTGAGFQKMSGRSGLSAAFAGSDSQLSDPIKTAKEIARTALEFENTSFGDGLPDPPTKTEAEIVASLWKRILERLPK